MNYLNNTDLKTVKTLDKSEFPSKSKAKEKLVDNLVNLKDKTIIFIAHRLAIAKRTNNILVLHQGKLVEQGTHAELIQKQGYYYDLIQS